MTFEEALSKVNKMTPAEKNEKIGALYLKSGRKEDDNGQIIEFLTLELDAETEEPTNNIIWLEVQQSTLPDGTYKTGDIVSFNIGGRERLFQILEYDVFDISGLLPPR